MITWRRFGSGEPQTMGRQRMSDFSRELAVAVQAVRQAARVCMAVRAGLHQADAVSKTDQSPVTVADYASQAVVASVLRAQCPQDVLVAEESAAELRRPEAAAVRRAVVERVAGELGSQAGEKQVLTWVDCGQGGGAGGNPERFWTLDPIDGTKGFLRGDQYAVALALVVAGRPVVGVLACPHLEVTDAQGKARGVLLAAVRGQGTRELLLEGEGLEPSRAVCVSRVSQASQARLCESYESGHSDHDAAGDVARRLGLTLPPVRMDSQAKYACVALGRAELYLRFPTVATRPENIWDHAAGVIVVEEAGGQVSDLAGQGLDFSRGSGLTANRGVVASNGLLQEAVLAALRGTGD